jgi:phosphoribosylamine--glycine ligase
MKILIIGSGAREHAIALALHRSTQSPRLFCCGTHVNPGIQQMTQEYWVGNINEVEVIKSLAIQWGIDLVFIGPEAPLEKGLADALWRESIPVIGPKRKLAQIETSKHFARDLMQKYKIPGLPKYKVFQDLDGVDDFLDELSEQYVIKADGLMGGKGVKVAGDHLHSLDDAMQFCQEIIAKKHTFIIEEKLIGQEFSLMCFCDGNHIVPMPLVQDHKRAYVDDKGPNTGGMGSYSDANHSLPFLSMNDIESAMSINASVIEALSVEMQEKYIGILYGSFIATKEGVHVIEFNARFGDPESLNVLTILESDFVELCQAMIQGKLHLQEVKFAPLATVCKYVVPEGYPDSPIAGAVIDIGAVKNKKQLYLGSVDTLEGNIVAMGSRTAAYVGVAPTISAAEEISEREVRGINGPLYHREDIGTEKLIQRRIDQMRKLRKSLCD